MPPRGSDLLASLRAQWQGLQPGHRRNILLAGAVVLAGVIVVAALSARGPAMAPLFTNLQATDAAAIVTQLDHSKVPYRLQDNGQTILVPAAQVDRVRLQLAGAGLPKSGTVGLGQVLTLPFGATDFTRQVAYQQGLQGELEQTIEQISGVSSSRVQLVLPQPSTFGGTTQPASASVLVDLQPGVTLQAGQVRGIVHLLAASVQGLSTDAITVIDQHGTILWTQGVGAGSPAGTATSGAGQAQTDFEVEQQLDQEMQQGLQGLLDQVFGPGNVIARVAAQLSFDSGTIDSKTYQPKGTGPAVVQSMQQLKQTVTGAAPSGTAPGTASNSGFPTYTSGAGGSNTSSTSSQLTQNFDVSSQTAHTVLAPGTVSRLSVAVVVNRTLTAAQTALVKSTVEAAVGYDPARSDQITVVGMPFNKSLVTSLQHQPASTPAHRPSLAVLIAAGALGPMLIGVLLAVLLRRPARFAAEVADADIEAAPADPSDPLGQALALAQNARARAEGALRQRPEEVARVIRVWLAQDE